MGMETFEHFYEKRSTVQKHAIDDLLGNAHAVFWLYVRFAEKRLAGPAHAVELVSTGDFHERALLDHRCSRNFSRTHC